MWCAVCIFVRTAQGSYSLACFDICTGPRMHSGSVEVVASCPCGFQRFRSGRCRQQWPLIRHINTMEIVFLFFTFHPTTTRKAVLNCFNFYVFPAAFSLRPTVGGTLSWDQKQLQHFEIFNAMYDRQRQIGVCIRVLRRGADVFPWQHSPVHGVVIYCTCVWERACPLATGFKGVAAKKKHPVVSDLDLWTMWMLILVFWCIIWYQLFLIAAVMNLWEKK